jgi:hypothetical protein
MEIQRLSPDDRQELSMNMGILPDPFAAELTVNLQQFGG